MLVETINEIREAGGDSRTLRLYGQEVNLTTAAIARMNLFLHDLEDFRIVRGDTLRDPRFLQRSGLRKFDVVVLSEAEHKHSERLKAAGYALGMTGS